MKKTFFILLFCLNLIAVYSQSIQLKIDQVVSDAMATFDVPGIAVAVVKDGEVIHSKGYGVRSIDSKEPVDEYTNFGIASLSKAFTSTALAILIDRGELKWDDRVITHIPEFKMYNEYVTQNFTIRDLLTHRSGLGLGAGDLMIWPDGHNFTSKDVIENIQYLPAVSDFRSKYDYDNLLYIIAGVVIERISGVEWSEFIECEIMKPLSMDHSSGNWTRLKDKANAITPHVPIEGKLQTIDRYTNTIFDAAAGIYSNITDLSQWMRFHLNKGKWNNTQLVSEKRHSEMWTPQTLIPVNTSPPYTSLFAAYGLGWRLTDVAGKLEVSHTGGLEGIVTQLTLLPQLDLGIAVLTNQQSGDAFRAITNTIKNHYLNLPDIDFVKEYNHKKQEHHARIDKDLDLIWKSIDTAKDTQLSVQELEKLLGLFEDPWFGTVKIYKKDNQYIFESLRSPQLTGEILYYKQNTFVVRWFNRYFNADAYINTSDTTQKKIDNFKMNALSPLTDFSYDFQDLAFKRKK